ARALTFQPQLIAGAAEEGGVACLDSLAKRLFVHEAHHQDASRRVILNHGRDQPVHLFEIQIHTAQKSPLRIQSPRASFLKFAWESLEIRPPTEVMAVMMMAGDGHS